MSKNYKTIEILIRTLFILIFVTLKLCNIVDWSWWCVFCPVWIPAISYVLWLCTIYEVRFEENLKKYLEEKI